MGTDRKVLAYSLVYYVMDLNYLGVVTMGLDVGVVKITYLDRPIQPMYDFLLALAAGDLDEDWGGGWEGNAFVEFMRQNLIEKADDWAERRGLGPEE
jgi:hypothetical protein